MGLHTARCGNPPQPAYRNNTTPHPAFFLNIRLECARGCVEQVQLGVVSENQPALRLYASLGFVEYGVERDALKEDGRYFDEVLMAKSLKSD
jgi:hypothetical protein